MAHGVTRPTDNRSSQRGVVNVNGRADLSRNQSTLNERKPCYGFDKARMARGEGPGARGENIKHRTFNAQQPRVANGEWRMEDGRWRWKMARTSNIKRSTTNIQGGKRELDPSATELGRIVKWGWRRQSKEPIRFLFNPVWPKIIKFSQKTIDKKPFILKLFK